MIAVTGANGLLGSFITRRLLHDGKHPVAIVRKDSDIHLIRDIQDKILIRYADVTDRVGIEEAFEDVTGIIHAAAVVSFNPANEEKIFKVNTEGTRNILEACVSRKIGRFLFVSSVAALGRQKDQPLVNEENKWLETELNSTYAKSKYLAELEVFRAHEEGLDTVIVNPSVILAPADWTKSSAQLFKYIWDERKFFIDSNLNFVDVRDVADAIIKLYFSDASGERFVVNGGTMRFQDFFSMVAEGFNKKAPSIKLAPATLKVLAFFETIRARISKREPLITSETARLAGTYFTYSSDKLKKRLDFQFHSIESTIKWCCSEYLNFIGKK